MEHNISKPSSATNFIIGMVGLVVLGWLFWVVSHNQLANFQKTLLVIGGCAFSMIIADQIIFKSFARASTGLDWKNRNLNIGRSAIKLCGLLLTLGLISFLYFIFPEYHGAFYEPLWDALKLLLPCLVLFSILYIVITDSVMRNPYDGYYAFGLIALLQWKRVDKSLLLPHARSWLIKAFFIPLMFVYMTNNMASLPGYFESEWHVNFLAFFNFAWMMIFSADLAFAVVGYIFAFRLIDTHERSSEPTMLGWVVALMCYQPFWSMFEKNYIVYEDNLQWTNIFSFGSLPMMIWGSAIIFLITVYTWATVAFGCRFSNLSNRGIITSGPYAVTKHPAYLCKNLSWWLVSMPFITNESTAEAFRHCVMLLMLNGVYFMRAWTEERHLLADPDYRAYQAHMFKNGLLRFLPNVWPKPKDSY